MTGMSPAPTTSTIVPNAAPPEARPDAAPQRQWPVGRAWHALIRRTGWLVVPLAGRRFFPIWLVIRHVGRTSGTPYATPVAGHRTKDGFVIPMPFGPHTQWAKNVLASGTAEMSASGHRYAVAEPRLLADDEALAEFNVVERAILRIFGTRNVLAVRTRGRLD